MFVRFFWHLWRHLTDHFQPFELTATSACMPEVGEDWVPGEIKNQKITMHYVAKQTTNHWISHN
jgi:hypothetical protein